jgi:anaerobic ribonucleoside-triphosphate reductase activating protein
VLWVQGCTIGCDGCFNKDLQPHTPKHLVEPVSFAKKIMQIASDNHCEGFTISGGEPFQQSRALNILSRELKKNNFTIVCFTGYTNRVIMSSKSPDINGFLENIDILIAGPYNHTKRHQYVWCDDADKEIKFFTNAYSKLDLNTVATSEYILDASSAHYTGYIDDMTLLLLSQNGRNE